MAGDAFQLDWDPRLADLAAADDARAAERIDSFAARNVEPAVRAATAVHLADLPAADRAEVAAACRDRLLGFLRAVHKGERTVPVADLDGYAAACADGACRDYLRRTRADRARLANRVRLLCTRGTGVVMWRSGDGLLIAGIIAWTHRSPLARPFPWAADPRAWWGGAPAAADGSALLPTVLRILEKAAAPIEMDVLTDLVAVLSGLPDAQPRLDASPEGDEPERAVLVPSDSVDHLHIARRYLERTWEECLAMPRYMRTAVLLSLRDQFGAGLLPVFHAAGVTPLRQVSEALGMKPDELAAIWAHLPWDDRAIGRRLGITGLQVLNLRTAARSRLLRALAVQDPGMITTEHLSLVQVRAYVSGALHPSTLVTIDDHLELCAACRAALARESDASFGAEAFGRALARPEARPESPHLAFEHLRGAVDGTLDAADAEWVEAHTALCVMCAEELRDLERFAAFVPIKIAPPPPAPEPVAPPAQIASSEPVLRRTRDTPAEGGVEPPPAYGAKPPARLPIWVWAAGGVALLLLAQMWAC